jgi:hypothetical protein
LVELGHRDFEEVAPVSDVPFVVGPKQHGAGEARQGLLGRGDTEDVGAPDYCG